MLSDIILLKKIKEGDIKAFEQLFRCFYSPLRLYAISITGRTDISEEIIQDLFYVLWEKRETIQILSSIKNYLYGAVRNRSLQYCEHRNVQIQHRDYVLSDNIGETDNLTPHQQLEYKELEKLINKVLDKMPERRLQIFRMHRFKGMKYAEIAQDLSISVKTVEAEITKALKSLRKVVLS